MAAARCVPAGASAKLRAKDEASGLALLDLDGAEAGVAPGLRAEPLSERETVVLVAFGEEGGKRAAVALPGQSVRIAAGAAVFAPLQPGQSGAPVFDRQGRLAGIVTGNPSDKVLIAGVAPQRAYPVAETAALQGLAAKAGLSLPAAAVGTRTQHRRGRRQGRQGGAADRLRIVGFSQKSGCHLHADRLR